MSFIQIFSDKLKGNKGPEPTNFSGGGFLDSFSRTLKEFPGALMEKNAEFVDKVGLLATDLLQGTARSVARITPFFTPDKNLTPQENTERAKNTTFTPQTGLEKAFFGDKPFSFKSAQDEVKLFLDGVGVDPNTSKKFAGPLVFVGGLLDAFPGGAGAKKGVVKTVEEGMEFISKSNKASDIVDTLVGVFKFGRKEANEIAPDLVNTKTAEEVKDTLKGFINEKVPVPPGAGGGAPKAAPVLDDIAGAAPKTDVKPPLPPGENPSGFAQTVANSPRTAPEIAKEVKPLTYQTVTNADTLAKADARIAANADEALAYVRNTAEPDAETYATGMQLISKYQNEGNYQLAIDVIRDLSPKATKQGQAIQVLSMYNRLTPEGILKYAVNEADKAGVGKKITKKFSDDIVKDAEKIKKMPEGPDKLFETAMILKKIDDLIPVGTGRKISTIQTMFQLLNPKTIGRNVIGNAGFGVMENISDVVATPFDSALSLFTKTRTKSLPSISAQVKGFKDGLRQGIKDAVTGVDTTLGTVASQFELSGRTFKSGLMEKAEKTLNVVLKGPDRAFYTAARDGSLASQLKAKGYKSLDEVPEGILDEMKEAAHLDGLYRTFQDDSALAGIFTGLKKALNAPTTAAFGQGSIGLGDFILKYPKTPANLLSRGLAYSPVGFVNTLIEMARPMAGGKFNQKRFVETFSRALTGTTAQIGLGAVLHKLGIITGKREDNANINATQRREGLGQYKINASALKRFVMGGFDPEQAQIQEGDKLVSYDWFQPISIGLSIGANFDEGGGDGSTVLGSMLSGLDTLAEQPLIQGVTRFTKSKNLSDGFMAMLESAPSSFVPTLVNQIRQVVDDKARNIYDTNFINRTKNSVQNRIPGLSDELPPQVNTFGENKRVYEAGENNFFNVFFNPAFVTTFKGTPEGQLVLDLYKDTGDVSQAPKIAEKSYKINGVNKKLTPEEFTAYQRFTGTYAKEIIGSLAQSEQFKSAPQEEQIKAISNLLSDIGSAGRIIILGNRPEKAPSKGVQAIMQRHLQLYGASQ